MTLDRISLINLLFCFLSVRAFVLSFLRIYHWDAGAFLFLAMLGWMEVCAANSFA